MPPVTVNDLNNAKLDCDTIAAIAISTGPTTIDRLGNIKPTMKGVVDGLNAQAAITETGANRAAAQLARVGAEAARDVALIQAGVYVDEPTGRAAVADGVAFKVQGTGDVAAFEYRRTSSTASVQIASYPASTAVINNRVLSAGDNYAVPPAVLAESLGTASPTLINIATQKGVMVNLAKPATIASVARSFAVRTNTALAGRTAQFYILRPSGSTYTVTFASALVDVSVAGVTTYNAPAPNALIGIAVGDVVGAFISSPLTPDGFLITQPAGGAGELMMRNNDGTQLAVGQTLTAGVGGYSTVTVWFVGLGMTTAHEALFVPARWANLPGGFARLDSAGKIPSAQLTDIAVAQLPKPLVSLTPRVAGIYGSLETTEFDPAVLITRTVVREDIAPVIHDNTYGLANPGSMIGSFPANQIALSWDATTPGFAKTGTLTRLEIPPGGSSPEGSKIQAWVVRPVSLVISGSINVSLSLVAVIGEIDANPGTNWRVFENLQIPVLAGDLVALRGINTGIPYGDSSAAYSNAGFAAFPVSADLTIAAMNAGVSTTSGADAGLGRGFFYKASITPGGYINTDKGPNSRVVRDALGNLPADTYRAFDMPWAGKKVVAVGTSITFGGNATANNGFINQTGPNLRCILDNQGVSSSRVSWQGNNPLSLSATAAELTAAGFNPNQSYENKLIGKLADLVIFDHGFNDNGIATGSIDSTDKSTFYGAYNVVVSALLADRPLCRIVFLTPPSAYINGVYSPGLATIATAIRALADKYKSPCLDFTQLLGIDGAARSTTFLADGTHPNDAGHARMARILYRFLLSV